MGTSNNNSIKNLKECKQAIQEFQNFLIELNSNSSNFQKNEGFLVNLNDYENLKKTVKENNNKENKNIEKLKTESINDISEKSFENNNGFIIINLELYEIICDTKHRNEHCIIYEIENENKIVIYSKDGQKKLEFKKNKDNIINKSATLKNEEKNEINKNTNQAIDPQNNIEDVKKFIENENYISTILKNKNSSHQKFTCYLVDKTWVDKWKAF